ncbi:MAG: protein kinase [Deltaproteobacteria bacterium]|jgi:serine/threonine protein kinase|nr:protein kinase [Deltaproteobacteria bacterium]MBW2535840.1 protein kinase [Deltaproteobacteria bacterium]
MAAGKTDSSDGTATLGQYELVLKLYDSELGTVWAARENPDATPEQVVAIREVSLGPPVAEETGDLVAEAWEWTADLKHDRLVPSSDVIMGEGRLGIVSQYVEAEPLTTLFRLASVRRLAVPVPAALHIALDILDGLTFLHEQADELSVPPEQVFGGLNPGNVLMTPQGRALLLEPGVCAAACAEKSWTQNPKRTAYLAPELITGDSPPTAATDVFSMGVLLWELLQNKRLFGGLSYAAVSKKVESGTIDRADSSKPAGGEEIPSEVADIVAKALERNADDRYASTAEMADAIRQTGLAAESPDDTGAVVEKLAGKSLSSRRTAIERALKGEVSPTGQSLVPKARGSQPQAAARKGPPPPKKGPPLPPMRGKGAPPVKRGGAAAPGKPPPPKPPKPTGDIVDESTMDIDDDIEVEGGESVGTEFDVPVSEEKPVEPPDSDDGDDDEDDEPATAILTPEEAERQMMDAIKKQKAKEDEQAAEDEADEDEAAADEPDEGEPASGEARPKLAIPRPGADEDEDDEPDTVEKSVDDEEAAEDEAPKEEDDEEQPEDDAAADADQAAGDAAADAERVEDGEAAEDEAAPESGDESEEPVPSEPEPSQPAAAAPAPLPSTPGDEPAADEGSGKKKMLLVAAALAVVVVIVILVTSGGDETAETGATTATPAAPVRTAEPETTTTSTETEEEEEEDAGAAEEEDAGEEDAGEEDAGEEEEDAGEPEPKPAPKPKGPRGPSKPKPTPKPRYVPGDL